MKNIDKSFKVLIVMIVIVGILYLANIFINKEVKIDYTKEEYITLKEEKIPTIYKIIGEKCIKETNNGLDKTGNYIEVVYKDLSLLEVSEYITYFRNNNYVLISSDTNNAVIANESNEQGKIITITVNFKENETRIKYSKGSGILTRD